MIVVLIGAQGVSGSVAVKGRVLVLAVVEFGEVPAIIVTVFSALPKSR